MSVQSREAKVFAALLLSMTTGAILLMVLGNNPPPAGAFCLDTYYQLDPIEEAVSARTARYPGRWHSIEIYYSGTAAGNIEQLASLSGLSSAADINCHFCLCNGLGGENGLIQPTEKWQRQWSIMPSTTHDSSRTIRICVIADGKTTRPTDYQLKRTEELVEDLCREFDIRPESVSYPSDWR